jgi:hypothetical protein
MKTDLTMITYDNDFENTITIQISEFDGDSCNIVTEDKEKNITSSFFKKDELAEFIEYLQFFHSKMD